jgi:RNA polymerase sporulation-specific sigma factor
VNGFDVVSMDAELTDDDGSPYTLHDRIGGWDAQTDPMLSKSVREAIKGLGRRERIVIKLRFYQDWTYQRVAHLFGVPPKQVQKIEEDALDRLNHLMAEG